MNMILIKIIMKWLMKININLKKKMKKMNIHIIF